MFLQRLEELIKEKGITKYKLSKDLNLPNSTIWNWQNGCLPTADKLILIADYFEVSTDYLLGRSNDIGIVQTNANLTQFENMLLSVVGKLSRDDQFQVLGFAQALAK